jgi:5-methylcytosine-specific restriction protein A
MRIRDDHGTELNSEIDVQDSEIILHSRSGKDRNRDYKQAFLAIVSRLRMRELRPAIYLDSLPVQHTPLEAREIWGPHETRPSEEQFAEIVRRMNAVPGSVSRGAWRRLLFKLPGHSAHELTAIISGRVS